MTGTKSKEKVDKLQDDSTKQQWPAGWKWPDDCLFAFAPATYPVLLTAVLLSSVAWSFAHALGARAGRSSR